MWSSYIELELGDYIIRTPIYLKNVKDPVIEFPSALVSSLKKKKSNGYECFRDNYAKHIKQFVQCPA